MKIIGYVKINFTTYYELFNSYKASWKALKMFDLI